MAKPPVDPWFCRLMRCSALLAPIVLGGAAAVAQSPPYGPPPAAPPNYAPGPNYVPGPAYAPAPSPAQPLAPAQSAEDLVVKVEIQGNRAVAYEKIREQIHTREGRPYDREMIEEDVVRLQRLRTFVRVQSFSQRVPGGRIVIFRLIERPILQEVRIIGCVDYAEKALKKEIGFKKGDAADPFEVQAGRGRLEDFYHKKGYNKVRVTIVEGNKPGQLRAIYTVNEGPATKIWQVNVVGASFVSGWHIQVTVPKTAPPVLYLFGGEADFKQIDEDCNRIVAYYRGFGFFQARVNRELEFTPDQRWVTVTFVVDEGVRSHIRNIGIAGNTKFATPELMEKLKLTAGKDFNQGEMNYDIAKLQEKYGRIGYVFADVKGELRYLDQPGQVDLVYNIHEGHRYRVNRVLVEIKGENPHTKITTVLQRMSIQPGEIVDIREIKDSERRIKASGLFLSDPTKGEPLKLAMVPTDAADVADGDDKDDKTEVARKPRSSSGGGGGAGGGGGGMGGGGYRGQSPDPPTEMVGTGWRPCPTLRRTIAPWTLSTNSTVGKTCVVRSGSWALRRKGPCRKGSAPRSPPRPFRLKPMEPPCRRRRPSRIGSRPPASGRRSFAARCPATADTRRPDVGPAEAPLPAPRPVYQPPPPQYPPNSTRRSNTRSRSTIRRNSTKSAAVRQSAAAVPISAAAVPESASAVPESAAAVPESASAVPESASAVPESAVSTPIRRSTRIRRGDTPPPPQPGYGQRR